MTNKNKCKITDEQINQIIQIVKDNTLGYSDGIDTDKELAFRNIKAYLTLGVNG